MTLIRSISGIRGTVGGKAGEGITPPDMIKYTSAFGTWIKNKTASKKAVIVLGRDARISGDMVERLVSGTLAGLGIDVINLSLATTPTVEMAVQALKADAGIILTASHNPRQWNALKLLNASGEFLSAQDGAEVLEIAERGEYTYAAVDDLGQVTSNKTMGDYHIRQVKGLSLVNTEAIQKAGFKVAVDCVNSVGGLVIPQLLKELGVTDIVELYCEPTGEFPHNPEPLPQHLSAISAAIKEHKADVGFVVDPDVDRLAIVNEDGSMFGEEYTLVAVADYILKHNPGNTVSNLSSTRALCDVTQQYGGSYSAAAVGEVNVVHEMKRTGAVIGGEGNGGVIYPPLHYGRDALAGISLFLSHLALSGKSCTQLRKSYPEYVISKNKIELTPDIDVDNVLAIIRDKFSNYKVNTIDGVKIDFEKEWVHLRKSNTEPIIRIYAESTSEESANALAEKIIQEIKKISRK
ncbi:MAG: phosphoglucosamine mutase [Bacteroidales bacterium]|nr:phosphoglucosamine mutase [Bacteroidales bacterium]